MSDVYTLVLEVTKIAGDNLPPEATGAAFALFVPARDEEEAVRDAVALFRQAGFNPLEAGCHGSVKERQKDGYAFSDEELGLVDEAREKDAIVIIDKQLLYDAGGQA